MPLSHKDQHHALYSEIRPVPLDFRVLLRLNVRSLQWGVSPNRGADTLLTFSLSKGNQLKSLGCYPPLLHLQRWIVTDNCAVYYRVSIRLGLE